MPQGVAVVVKPDRMGQLRKEQTDHMTPWREGARLFIDPVLPGEFFRQMRPDEFTKLMQGAAVVFGRRYVFHTADSLVGIRRRPPFFNPARKGVSPHPVGWLWIYNTCSSVSLGVADGSCDGMAAIRET